MAKEKEKMDQEKLKDEVIEDTEFKLKVRRNSTPMYSMNKQKEELNHENETEPVQGEQVVSRHTPAMKTKSKPSTELSEEPQDGKLKRPTKVEQSSQCCTIL